MKRLKLNLTSVSEAYEFLNKVNNSSLDDFELTNSDNSKSSDPKTRIGIVYALSEFDEIYLINRTHDGIFPEGVE